uniref:Ceramide kinase n=1 Tax=Magallana gigas TaxID=29159 RepID=K1QT64_MAGGI
MVLNVNVKSVILEARELKISDQKTTSSIEICDVIGCHLCEEPGGFLPSFFGSTPYLVIKYISKCKNYKWTAENVHVTGSREECEALRTKVNEKLGQETERPKKLGVFINPIGGSQNSLNVYSKTITPLFRAANIKYASRKHTWLLMEMHGFLARSENVAAYPIHLKNA